MKILVTMCCQNVCTREPNISLEVDVAARNNQLYRDCLMPFLAAQWSGFKKRTLHCAQKKNSPVVRMDLQRSIQLHVASQASALLLLSRTRRRPYQALGSRTVVHFRYLEILPVYHG